VLSGGGGGGGRGGRGGGDGGMVGNFRVAAAGEEKGTINLLPLLTEKMQDTYWSATIVPIKQLSHFVF
jgi:hypothetical protein